MRRVKVVVCAFSVSAAACAQMVSLSEAESRAVQKHPALAAAHARIEIVRASGRGLLAPYLPMLSLNGYVADGTSGPIAASTVEPLNYMMLPRDQSAIGNGMFMWKVFSGGRDRTAALMARAGVASAEGGLRSAELDVRLRVRAAFAEALEKQEKVEAEKTGVEAAEELERVTKERFEAGKVPEAFLFRASADAAKARRMLAMAEAERDAALAILKESMGAAQTEGLTLGAWDAPTEVPDSLEKALSVAAKQRPEVVTIRKEREAATLRGRLASQSRLPEVSLFAMDDLMGTETDGGNFYKVGVVASFPVLDGGRRKAEVDESRAMAKRAEAEGQELGLRIQSEVASAWANWKAAPAVLAASEAEVAAAREGYRVAKLRYEEGKSIQVEAAQALADFIGSLAGRAEAVAFERSAWAKLMRAIGQ